MIAAAVRLFLWLELLCEDLAIALVLAVSILIGGIAIELRIMSHAPSCLSFIVACSHCER